MPRAAPKSEEIECDLLFLLLRVLYVFVEPVELLGEHMQAALASSVDVIFIRHHHQTRGSAQAFQRGVHALRLDRIGAGAHA